MKSHNDITKSIANHLESKQIFQSQPRELCSLWATELAINTMNLPKRYSSNAVIEFIENITDALYGLSKAMPQRQFYESLSSMKISMLGSSFLKSIGFPFRAALHKGIITRIDAYEENLKATNAFEEEKTTPMIKAKD